MIDTKIEIENVLDPDDEKLFLSTERQYISKEEQEFFEKLHVKMLSELAASGELLISEKENEDGIYLLREQYDEFIVGQGFWGSKPDGLHTMNLIDVLSANMLEQGFLKEDITLLGWLRSRNYKGVMYNHNYTYR